MQLDGGERGDARTYIRRWEAAALFPHGSVGSGPWWLHVVRVTPEVRGTGLHTKFKKREKNKYTLTEERAQQKYQFVIN